MKGFLRMFYIDKRILYAVLGILLLVNIVSRLNNTSSILALILSLPAILIAITFHEFAHALAADRLGDDTPKSQGRLTLNPLAHIDVVGLVLLIVAGFGWGKPVQVNPNRFNRKVTMQKGEIIVSLLKIFSPPNLYHKKQINSIWALQIE